MRTVTAGNNRSARRSYPGCNPSGSMLPSASSEGSNSELNGALSMNYSLDIWILRLRPTLKGDCLGLSKQIKPAKIIDLGPGTLQKLGAVNNDRKAQIGRASCRERV